MLAIEGVLALHHAGFQGLAQVFGGLYQGAGDVEIGHGRVLDGGILPAGVLKADGPGGHHHVAGAHVQVDAAAGAHPDEGIRADVVQLLHGDGGGGAADAGGADGDLFPQQGAGIDGEFAVLGHKMGVVEQGRDLFAAAGVAGQDDVTAHVALHAVDMELFVQLLHSCASLIIDPCDAVIISQEAAGCK